MFVRVLGSVGGLVLGRDLVSVCVHLVDHVCYRIVYLCRGGWGELIAGVVLCQGQGVVTVDPGWVVPVHKLIHGRLVRPGFN